VKLSAPLIGALIFAGIHVLLVVIPVVTSGGGGEGQAMSVAYADFPLVLLLEKSGRGSQLLYGVGRTREYVWFFSIAGTLMYALVGLVLGVLVRSIFGKRHSNPE
jgi:hypothetical protein